MLGAIIGDIAGSDLEVKEVEYVKTINKMKKDNSVENINDYFNKKLETNIRRIKILNKNTNLFDEKKTYTDDTILTCAVADSLLNNIPYAENLKKFTLREINLGLDKYGRNRFGKNFIEWVNGNNLGISYGNGCAMRVSPIPNYYNNYSKMIDETIKLTKTSHDNIESYNASEAVSTCIFLAKTKRKKKAIKKIIQEDYGYKLDYNLYELKQNYKFTSRSSDSVPQAIYCFLESNNFEDAIRKALSIGGDSDTIAAITGSIAEAYYGIPENLIKEVEKYLPEYILNIVNEFYKILGKEEPFKNKVKDFFKEQKLYSEEFFDYIKDKIKYFPSGTDLSWFGCFPQIKDNKIDSIRLLVPEIKTEQDLLVNIHEFYHAYEIYNELGEYYNEKREIRESKAREMEKIYKKNKSI